MALTPEKRMALAEKGYTAEEIAGLEAKTDEFRQRLAAMGVSMKDVNDAPPEDAPPAEKPPAVDTPPPAPAAPAPNQGFTLDDLRNVIREEVGAQTKELATAVKELQTGAKQTDDEKFAAMWKERMDKPPSVASKDASTVVGAGSKEAVAAGTAPQAWVNNMPLFQWLGENGMGSQGVNGQGG